MTQDKRYKIGDTISGDELFNFLKNRSLEKVTSFHKILAKYDNESVTKGWYNFIWHLEEFINIFYELDESDKGVVFYTPIGFLSKFSCHSVYKDTLDLIKERFGEEVKSRFNIFISLYAHLPIVTIKCLFEYCCSRRLHYMSMMYLLSKNAIGSEKVHFSDLIKVFQPYIENDLTCVTTAYHAMIETKCLENFYAEVKMVDCLEFSHQYCQLEGVFLEPQRLSEEDLLKYSKKIDRSKLRKKYNNRPYSIEEYEVELDNEIIYYSQFGIMDNPEYKQLYEFAVYAKKFISEDEYHIEINETEFKELGCRFSKLNLYKESESLFEIQNTRFAFVKIGKSYFSTIFMLQRFRVNVLNNILRRNRKYQIASGFIFEKKVIDILNNYGFEYQENCKRIRHKEFDVVCIKDGVIYNFQCKNNYFDVTQIDTRNVDIVVRYHKLLAKYYDKALLKEEKRELLLKEKLNLEKVENFVISRFPVITSNNRVLTFNELENNLKLMFEIN